MAATEPQDPQAVGSPGPPSSEPGPAGEGGVFGTATLPASYVFELPGVSQEYASALVWISAAGKATLSFAPKYGAWGEPIWGERA
jgi:hypothetical protein